MMAQRRGSSFSFCSVQRGWQSFGKPNLAAAITIHGVILISVLEKRVSLSWLQLMVYFVVSVKWRVVRMDGRLWWLALRTASLPEDFVYRASLIVDTKFDLRWQNSNISGIIRNPAMSRLWKLVSSSRPTKCTATSFLQSTSKSAKIGFKDIFVCWVILL